MTFTEELQRLTHDAHAKAEEASFISQLLAGKLSESDYTRLIGQYLPVYSALENAARELRSQEPLAAFYDERLARGSAIRRDLSRLGIDPAEVAPLRATTVYVERLSGLAEQANATRVLAHHYLRYLGDLSGGQVIGRLVQRHYNITDDALTMWNFAAIGKSKPYKDAYRAKLNSQIAPDQQSAFIDECLQGYQLARDLFEDLSESFAVRP